MLQKQIMRKMWQGINKGYFLFPQGKAQQLESIIQRGSSETAPDYVNAGLRLAVSLELGQKAKRWVVDS